MAITKEDNYFVIDKPIEEMLAILEIADTESKDKIVIKRRNKNGLMIDHYTAKLVKVFWENTNNENKEILLKYKLKDRINIIIETLKNVTNFKES
jgi:hypothetical protein